MILAFLLCAGRLAGQTYQNFPSIAVVEFHSDVREVTSDAVQQMLGHELINLKQFRVIDKFDAEYAARRDSFDLNGCLSQACLLQAAKILGADKMLTGSLTQMGNKISIVLRQLDVDSQYYDREVHREYVNLPAMTHAMLKLTFNDLYGRPNDQVMVRKLTIPDDFASNINNPYSAILKADGPRSGLSFATGEWASVLTRPVKEGGYGGYPFMFQFGYQFEKQYLNEGSFQGLFEVLTMISGADQGRFVPSFTFLNGLRNNKNGWEFAFGPTFSFAKYRQEIMMDGTWYYRYSNAYDAYFNKYGQYPDVVNRLHADGDEKFTSAFLIGIGRTLRSGRMNIPINAFVIPGKNGTRFGISIGWNSGNQKRSN